MIAKDLFTAKDIRRIGAKMLRDHGRTGSEDVVAATGETDVLREKKAPCGTSAARTRDVRVAGGCGTGKDCWCG
jgi:hypothetical protein